MFVGGLLCIAAVLFKNPAREAPAAIRQRLLTETPPGTQISDVSNWIARELKVEVATVGEGKDRSLKAKYGTYWGLLSKVDVYIYWSFDEHRRVTDIHVASYTDGP
jgi:hypothetical protein